MDHRRQSRVLAYFAASAYQVFVECVSAYASARMLICWNCVSLALDEHVGLHEVVPSGDIIPAGQSTHDIAPATAMYFPAGLSGVMRSGAGVHACA